MTDAATTSSPATLVPEARRMAFLPALFSLPLMLIGERAVYQFMSWLAPDDYSGGLWQFHEQNGQPLFLSPKADKRFRLFCETNGYVGAQPRLLGSSPPSLPCRTSPSSTRRTSSPRLICGFTTSRPIIPKPLRYSWPSTDRAGQVRPTPSDRCTLRRFRRGVFAYAHLRLALQFGSGLSTAFRRAFAERSEAQQSGSGTSEDPCPRFVIGLGDCIPVQHLGSISYCPSRGPVRISSVVRHHVGRPRPGGGAACAAKQQGRGMRRLA